MNLSSRISRESSTVVIVGCGGFASETLDVIEAHNHACPDDHITVAGVVDNVLEKSAEKLLAARGIRFLGSDDDWLTSDDPTALYIIALADPAIKRRIDERYASAGRVPHPGIIHPDAGIGSSTVFGPGVVVCAGAQVSTNVRAGRHVHINPNATVGHDATIADFVTLNPAAVISGHVQIATGCLIGAGAVILERRHVGPWSTVGAAACVVRDVVAGSTVKGVPAR